MVEQCQNRILPSLWNLINGSHRDTLLILCMPERSHFNIQQLSSVSLLTIKSAKLSTDGYSNTKSSPRYESSGMPKFTECCGGKLKSKTILLASKFLFFSTGWRGEKLILYVNGSLTNGPDNALCFNSVSIYSSMTCKYCTADGWLFRQLLGITLLQLLISQPNSKYSSTVLSE